jgi:hypothetical protein
VTPTASIGPVQTHGMSWTIMKKLNDRIARGQAAIAKAKAQGRDTSEWEAHLRALTTSSEKPQTKPDPDATEDRGEAQGLRGVCWNCGALWSEVVTDIYGRRWKVCWSCSKTA